MVKTVSAKSGNKKSLPFLAKAAICAGTVYGVRKLAAKQLPGEPSSVDRALRDKVALIVGGSRGLGLAIAMEFGAHGARLALAARDQEELNEACLILREKGYEAEPFVADIEKREQTSALIERVIAQFGPIDILVNDAGAISVAPFDNLSHEDFENAMNLMFWGPVNLTFAALPHMRERRAGQIVNITSVGGRVSVPHLLPYSCAKFAFVGFSSGLASEIKRHGIHVLTVVPGLMRTGSYLNAKFGGESKQEFTWFSLLGNTPGLSVSASYAAKQIVDALQRGEYNRTISLPVKMLVASEALMPNTTRSIMSVANALLPSGRRPSTLTAGEELNVDSNKLFQTATALGKEAARRFNE